MKIMAVDYGDARTGLAACDRTEFLASPLGVIHEYDFDRTIEQVAYAAQEYQIGKIVVGHPSIWTAVPVSGRKNALCLLKSFRKKSMFPLSFGTNAAPPSPPIST